MTKVTEQSVQEIPGIGVHILLQLVASVALLVTRQTNNRQVMGLIPANTVCFTVDK